MYIFIYIYIHIYELHTTSLTDFACPVCKNDTILSYLMFSRYQVYSLRHIKIPFFGRFWDSKAKALIYL